MDKQISKLNTQLINAVKNYRTRKVSKLLKKGADPNTLINEDGKTLVMEAASLCFPKTLNTLIESGADIHLKTKEEGLNAFLYACNSGCIETIKILLDAGADIHSSDMSNKNGLMYTVRYHDYETIEYLYEKGININAQDIDGETIFYYARENIEYEKEYETTIEYVSNFINLGADINLASSEGYTALSYAVRSENLNVVQFLIEKGADVKQHGNDLFSIALGNDSRDITEFLWEHSYKDIQLCIRYAVDSKCTHCNALLPVNGPVKNLLCPSCQTENEIEESYWTGILEDSVFMKASTIDTGYGKYELERIDPVCIYCQTEIELSVIDSNDQNITCKSCGKHMKSYDAPDWLQKKKVYGLIPKKVISTGNDQEQPDDKKSVGIKCTSCNAELKVTSSSKPNFECDHCSTNQYLTDAVWLVLHPIETKKMWYIRFA